MDRATAMQMRADARVGSVTAESDIRFWILPIALIGMIFAVYYFSYKAAYKVLS